MTNLLDTAVGIIVSATKRVEVSGQNIANMTTPGYKRQLVFSDLLSSPTNTINPNAIRDFSSINFPVIATDFSAGEYRKTDDPFNVALSGKGFFVINTPTGAAYTREGQFKRDENGRLVTAKGWPVQAQGGGDIVLHGQGLRIEADGTIIDEGRPLTRLAVVDFADHSVLVRSEGGFFQAPTSLANEVDYAFMRQGYLEASNVSNGADMINIMESLRRAEAGQKIVLTYDDMMGRVLTTLGQI